MSENDNNDVQTYDDEMVEDFGDRSEWEEDAKQDTSYFANAYRAFLENGCRGILTYEEAVEEYKSITGRPPETVTSWPELDWVKQQRGKAAKEAEFIKEAMGMELDEYFAMYLPYEPMMRIAF